MRAVGSFIANNWKWIVLVIILLIIIIYLRKNWFKVKRIFLPRDVNFVPGETTYITEDRKQYIESLASAIYRDIEDTPYTGHNYTPYYNALQLTDNELLYLAKYYRKYLSNEYLFDALGSQVYVTDSEVITKLKSRLNKLGEGV